MEFRLIPNQSENGKCNLISVWFNKILKIFLCVDLKNNHEQAYRLASHGVMGSNRGSSWKPLDVIFFSRGCYLNIALFEYDVIFPTLDLSYILLLFFYFLCLGRYMMLRRCFCWSFPFSWIRFKICIQVFKSFQNFPSSFLQKYFYKLYTNFEVSP